MFLWQALQASVDPDEVIDRMQPQFAAYVGATVQGDVPVAGMAELFVEMAPAHRDWLRSAVKAGSARACRPAEGACTPSSGIAL